MDYLEDVLAPDVRSALEHHVAGCQRCLAFVESYRRAPDIVRRATDVSLPPELAQRLQTSLRRQTKRTPRRG